MTLNIERNVLKRVDVTSQMVYLKAVNAARASMVGLWHDEPVWLSDGSDYRGKASRHIERRCYVALLLERFYDSLLNKLSLL